MNNNLRLLLLLILILVLGWFTLQRSQPGTPGEGPSDPCTFPGRIDPQELVYVNHAKCRMECRQVPRKLVEEVYLEGSVNCGKSGPKNGDMRYALEKRDDRGDIIRLIIEVEDGEHIVITVIRLGQEDRCTCS